MMVVHQASESRIREMFSGMSNSRSRVSSAELKVPHTRIEEEKVLEETYKFGNKLGQGSFGIVIQAKHTESQVGWAIKMVNKEKAGGSGIKLLEREVSILKRVRHQNIIHLEEVFETPKKMYLVMELCELGELRSLLDKRGPFGEESTKHIIRQLLDAITYLHRSDIVHRDLKLENILVIKEKGTSDSPLFDIKVTDFGLSVVKGGVGPDGMLQSFCGTPVYMAPEVIQNHEYSQQCDMWSIGVIMYCLLSKVFPWISDKEEKLFELIKRAELDFSKPIWKTITETAKLLLKKLLHVDPAHRLTASEVLEGSPWILGEGHNITEQRINVLEMMKKFAKEEKNTESDDLEDRSDSSELQSSGSSDFGAHGLPSPKKPVKSAVAHNSQGTSSHRRASLPVVPIKTYLKKPAPNSARRSSAKSQSQRTSSTSSPVSSSGPSKSTRHSKSPSSGGSERTDCNCNHVAKGGLTAPATDYGVHGTNNNGSSSKLGSRVHTPSSGNRPDAISPNRGRIPGSPTVARSNDSNAVRKGKAKKSTNYNS